MPHPDNPFGAFKSDRLRLEAVWLREDRLRLRERRLFWLGISTCIVFTVACVFTDHLVMAAILLATLYKALSQ